MSSRVRAICLSCVLKMSVAPQTLGEVGLELKITDCKQNHFRDNGCIITVIIEAKLSKENEWELNTVFSEE